jgi:hypothetical protein
MEVSVMWLFTFNEYTVLILVLAVGLAAILLIRRYPGYKPTGTKKPRSKRESEFHPILHRRQEHHHDDHDRHV